MNRNSPAVLGPVESSVRPHAIRLASQLQSAAYSHGYEDGHPSNATTRQDKYSAASQRLRSELCEAIDTLVTDADELRALAEGEGTRAVEYLRRAKKAEAEVKKLRDAALWALMHHQGGSSPVGQPLRKALGIPPHADLTQEQFNAAKEAAGIWGPNGA